MVSTLQTTALGFYVVAAAILVGALVRGCRSVPRAAGAVLIAGVAVHAAALVLYTLTFDELPLVGLASILSLLAFLIGVFLIAALAWRDLCTLGLVLVPLVIVLVTAGSIFGPPRPIGEPLEFTGPWFVLHVTLALAGCAGLAIAFAAGMVYLLQRRELKGKNFGRVFRFFPSLVILATVGRYALITGFTALSTSLVIGWGWAYRYEQPLALNDPKVLWGGLTWMTFVAVFSTGAWGVAGERRSAVASVIGFVLVTLVYVALRIVGSKGPMFL